MTNPENLTILNGNCIEQLKTLPDNSVQCCVTSPPYYGLRSYLKNDDPAKAAEIGAEQTPDQYVKAMVEVFREVKRVLREDGVFWLTLGDSYPCGGRKNRAADTKDNKGGRESDSRPDTPNGLKPKDLLMIPAKVAIALQADGWYLRAACPWIKRNGMPESVKDRPSQTIEQLFMLTKSERYYYDAESIRSQCSPDMQRRAEAGHTRGANGKLDDSRCDKDTLRGEHAKTIDTSKGRLRRSGDWFFETWQGMLQDEDGDPLAFVVNTKPYKGAHFAVFPPELIAPCVKSATSEAGSCPKCGTPLKRMTKRVASVGDAAEVSEDRKPLHAQTYSRHKFKVPGGQTLVSGHDETVGWEVNCSCEVQPPIPCVVLDPFGGSGTTAKVALDNGRKAVIIELNKEYIPLIYQRCGLAAPQAAPASL